MNQFSNHNPIDQPATQPKTGQTNHCEPPIDEPSIDGWANDGAATDGLTLGHAQSLVDDWIKTLGVRYFSELTNLAQLVEEVGEVSRIMSRTYGEQSFKSDERDADLGDELADVLFVLICIANQTGVDLTSALRKNLQKKTDRDATRHLENPKLAANSANHNDQTSVGN